MRTLSDLKHADLQTAAREYRSLGWHVHLIKHRGKRPIGEGWQKRDSAEPGAFAPGAHNIGVLLGEKSGGLVDVDFDLPHAARVADVLLKGWPSFGRAGNPRSHRLALCEVLNDKTTQVGFRLPDSAKEAHGLPRTMVLELRANTHQTVFPPSVHDSMELVQWEPGELAFQRLHWHELLKLCGLISFLGVVAKFWPAEGGRHAAALALGGALVAAGYDDEEVKRYVTLAAQVGGDDDWADRAKECNPAGTRDKILADKPVLRLHGLCAALNITDLQDKLAQWLELNEGPPAYVDPPAPKHEDGTDKTVLAYETPDDSAQKFLVLPEWRDMMRYNGDYLQYLAGAYVEVEDEAVSAAMSRFMKGCVVEMRRKGIVNALSNFEPYVVNPTRRNAAVDLLRDAIHRRASEFEMPCWLEPGHPAAREFIACGNALLHWPTMQTYPLTPRFATRTVLRIAYDPAATCPRWAQTVEEVFPGDLESQECLQEIFGYVISGITSYQKMFALLGSRRGGKGTMLRVLQKLVGEGNYVNLSLNHFGSEFGLQGAIGKQAIVITDARIDRTTPQAAVVERTLNISGEDSMQIPRKWKAPWNGRLGARIVIATNSLPRLRDTGGAWANRFIVLHYRQNFEGREDFTLEDKLTTELPGILNWSLRGLQRLLARRRFAPPAGSAEVVAELDEAGSPVGSFFNDCCIYQLGARVPKDEVWQVYRVYARAKEHPVLNDRDFALELYAATQHKVYGKRVEVKAGLKVPHFINMRLPVNDWIAAAKSGALDEEPAVQIPADLLAHRPGPTGSLD